MATRRYFFILSLSVFVAASLVPLVSYATWNGSPYAVGSTLNPECAPTDENCTVAAQPSWNTLGVGTTTPDATLSVLGNGGSGLYNNYPTLFALTAQDTNPWAFSLRRQDIGTSSDVSLYNGGDSTGGMWNFAVGDGAGSYTDPFDITKYGITVHRTLNNNLISLGGTGSNWGFISDPAPNTWGLGYGLSQSNSGTPALVWNTSGHIGIGTNTPQAKLDVVSMPGTDTGDVVASYTSNDAWQSGFSVANLSSSAVWQFMVGGNENNSSGVGVGNFGFYNAASHNFPLVLQRDTDNVILDNGSGLVGIGTDSPQAKLDVNGGIHVTNGGSDAYINFGEAPSETIGEGGYGFRVHSGVMQFKNENGSWIDIGAGTTISSGGGLAGSQLVHSADISGQVGSPFDLMFGDSGHKMYVVDTNTGILYEYALSTSWDVSSASYTGLSYSSDIGSVEGVALNADGTRLYMENSNAMIYQFDLGTSWDVSGATFNGVIFYASAQVGSNSVDIAFSTDGTKLYMSDYTSAILYEYTLGSAWDLSTASYSGDSFDTGANTDGYFGDINFNANGTRLYAGDYVANGPGAGMLHEHQYTLSVPWDITTATYDHVSYLVSEHSPDGLSYFSPDGTKFYVTVGGFGPGNTPGVDEYAFGGASAIENGLAGQIAFYGSTGSSLNATSSLSIASDGSIHIDSGSASSYLNFSTTTSGEAGYGIRVNNGVMQFKNSGGEWTNMGGGDSTWSSGDAGIHYIGGSVGIGTSTSNVPLAVEGSHHISFTKSGSYTPSGSQYRDAFLVGTTLYVADVQTGLDVFDVSDASNPKPISVSDAGGSLSGVFVSGHLVFGINQNYVEVWDTADPRSLQFVGGYYMGGSSIGALYVKDGMMYVSDGTELLVYDVSQLSVENNGQPSVLGYTDVGQYINGIAVANGTAYLATNTGIFVEDVSSITPEDSGNPTQVGYYAHDQTWDVAVSGNELYAVAIDASITSYALSNGGHTLSQEDSVRLDNNYYDNMRIKIVGNYAYVVDGQYDSVFAAYIADPVNIELAGHYGGGNNAFGLAVSPDGQYVYIADYEGGLLDLSTSVPLSTAALFTNGTVRIGATATSSPAALNVAGLGGNDGIKFVSTYTSPHGGVYIATAVVGTYAYVVNGQSGFDIVDVSAPYKPVTVSSYTPDGTYLSSGPVVEGKYAYFTDATGAIEQVDISDPYHPRNTGQTYTSGTGYLYDIKSSGAYLFALNQLDQIEAIDSTIPSNLVGAGTVSPHSTLGFNRFYISGSRLLGVNADGNIELYGGSNLGGVAYISTYTPQHGRENQTAILGNYMYVRTTYHSGTLEIVDISDISAPTYVGQYRSTTGYLGDFAVKGNFVYEQNDNGQLEVIDVSHPAQPVFVSNITSPTGWYAPPFISGNYLYASNDNSQLEALDISNPKAPISAIFTGGRVGVGTVDPTAMFSVVGQGAGSPILKSAYTLVNGQDGYYVSGNYLYVLRGDDANVDIVDVSNPLQLSKVATYSVDGAMQYPFVLGNTLYVHRESGQIEVVDVSDHTNPTSKSLISAQQGQFGQFSVQGNMLYAADDQGYLESYDVSSSTNPTFVQEYLPEAPINSADPVIVSGNYVYSVVSNENNILVSDVTSTSTYSAATYIGTNEESPIRAFSISDNVLYLLNSSNHIELFDASNPANIPYRSTYLGVSGSPTFNTYSPSESGNLFAGENCGIDTVNVSYLNSPTLSDVYPPSSYCMLAPFVSNGYAYSLNSSGQIVVFDLSAVSHPTSAATFTDGRVGINTTSPQALLDVNGNAIISGYSRYLNFGDSGAGTQGYGIRDNAGTMQFKNSNGSWVDIGGTGGWTTVNGGIEYAGGNVGIGTANPSFKLGFSPASSATIGVEPVTNYSGVGGDLSIEAGTGTAGANAGGSLILKAGNAFTGGGESAGNILLYAGANNYSSGGLLGNIIFYKGGLNGAYAEAMRMNSDGNFGIGTTNPETNFDVNGSEILSGENSYLNFGGNGNPSDSTGANGYGIRDNGGTLQFKNSGGEWTNFGTSLATSLNLFGTSTPTSVGSVATNGGYPVGIAVQGDYAYVTNSTSGSLSVSDISDPANPKLLATLSGLGVNGGGDTPEDVAVLGRYAYVTSENDNALYTVDITNPSAPSIVATLPLAFYSSGGPDHIRISGSYAYVTDNTLGLLVVDIHNPLHPIVVGIAQVPGAEGVAVSGSNAYVADSINGRLDVVDVTDPRNPTISTSTLLGSSDYSYGVAVDGSRVYVTGYNTSTLWIYDISNPSAPVRLAGTETHDYPMYVSVAGKRAYITTLNGLDVYNISSSTAPIYLGLKGGTAYAGLAVVGRYAYVVEQGSGPGTLRVLDLEGSFIQQLEVGGLKTSSLTVAQALSAGSGAFNGGLSVGTSILAQGGVSSGGISSFTSLGVGTNTPHAAFEVVGAQDAGTLTLVSESTTEAANTIVGLARSNTHLYAAVGSSGFEIFDTDGAGSVISVGGYTTDGYVAAVYAVGSLLYAGDGNNLDVFDVSDPSNAVLLGSVDTTGFVTGIVVMNGLAYVTSNNQALGVYDVSAIATGTPGTPTRVGDVFETDAGPEHLAVDATAGYAYVVENGSLEVINISDPTAMSRMASFTPSEGYISGGVAVSGTHAFVTSDTGASSQSFIVVDISNPAHPAAVGFADIGQWRVNTDVVIRGTRAYVSDGNPDSVYVIDISNPLYLHVLGHQVTTADYSRALVVDDEGNIFVGENGVLEGFSVGSQNLAALFMNGSVGIGTESPQATLEIGGAGVGSFMGSPALLSLHTSDESPWNLVLQNDSAGPFGTLGFTLANNGVLYVENNVGDTQVSIGGSLSLNGLGYINFGSSNRSAGYGIRDAMGTLQFKNSGGEWTNFGSGSGLWVDDGSGNISYDAGNVSFGGGSFSYASTTGETTIDSLHIGALEFPTDAGVVSWIDLPVGSAQTEGTPDSYTATIGGNSVLTVYGESDGAGGVENLRVGIATTSPWTTFAVAGTVALDGLPDSGGISTLCLDANNQVVTNIEGGCTSSTERIKHDIHGLTISGTSTIMELTPSSFVYNTDASSTVRWGFIAEDLASTSVTFVDQFDKMGKPLTINPVAILSVAVKAIQELTATVAAFADRFTTQEVDTQKLCVGDTCVTQEQLKALLQSSAVVGPEPSAQSVPAPTSNIAPPDVTPEASSTQAQEAPVTDPAPAPIPDNTGTSAGAQ